MSSSQHPKNQNILPTIIKKDKIEHSSDKMCFCLQLRNSNSCFPDQPRQFFLENKKKNPFYLSQFKKKLKTVLAKPVN